MNKFRTVVSILCGVAGLFLGASLNNAIGGCILGVLISALPQDQKRKLPNISEWHLYLIA